MQTVSTEHIEISPLIRNGKPRIAGTRIAVEDIAVMHLKMGYSLIEIAGKYNLSLGSVYAAMAYYFDNREEIDSLMTQELEYIEELKRNYPSKLQEKLRSLRSE